MSVQDSINNAEQDFKKALDHLHDEFARLQVGRANPALVENISVEVYGASQPIKAIASIGVPEPRTLQITPWDKGSLASIEKAIVGAGIGLNPVNDGICVRISMPVLTEERRAELKKHVHKLSEDAKITVRTARQDAHNQFKEMKSRSEITEDDLHDADKGLQVKVDEYNGKVDEMAKKKEEEVMTV
ncbi:ribosome recycling factor [Patescibacteria group bacterium]|nr:ribosome recycling factor [Patescibacteria group bacterium]